MSSDASSIPSESMSPLRDNDVLFGRGKGPQYHPGNVAFRALVDSRKADYWSENQEYGDKMQLANEVYDAIVTPKSSDEPGGRFLKQADDMDAVLAEISAGRSVSMYGGKYYIEVPRKVAVDKCKMALRQKGNPADQREARRRKRLSMTKIVGEISVGSCQAGTIAAPVSAAGASANIGGAQPDMMPSASASALMGDMMSLPFPMMNISPALSTTLSGPFTSTADVAVAAAAADTSATSPPIHLDSLQLDSDLLLPGEDRNFPSQSPQQQRPPQPPERQQNVINDVLVEAALTGVQAGETTGEEVSHSPQQLETATAAAAAEHFHGFHGMKHASGRGVGNLDTIPLEQMHFSEPSVGSTRTTMASLEDSQETILSCHSHIQGQGHSQGQKQFHDDVSALVEAALVSVQMYRSSVEDTAGFDANFLGRILYDLFIEAYGDETADQTTHDSHCASAIGGSQRNDTVAEPAKRERRNTDSYQSLAMLGCPVVLSNLIGCLLNQTPSEVFYSSSNEVESDLRDILLNRNWANEASGFGGGHLCFDDDQVFGRDEELRTLFSTYDRVVRQRRESRSFLAISGFSGTGKTSLVNQLCSHLLADDTSLIRCNFTVQGQSMSVLFEAFDDYCRIMSGNDDRDLLDRVRRDVKEALGLQSGILLGCLPSLRSLLGESVDSPTMTAETKEEEMNRVLFYFIKFVRAISRPEHPTVFVFDDIQWCDESCLDLVRLILRDTEITSALFIGCYRDEKVINDNPFGELFGELEMEASLPMTSIKLTNLSIKGVNEFVSSALCLNKRFTRPLAGILHRKTQGNPMFVRQLLLSLAGDGLLNFSVIDRRWQWNIEAIAAKSIAKNSVSLMVGMMKTYQQSDQDALRLAALLGTTFKVEILERLFVFYDHGTKSDFSSSIERAISGGIIFDEGFGSFCFSHDQLFQAARALTPSQEQPLAHLDIGRRLLKSIDGDVSGLSPDFVATIVDQYNGGISLITDHDEELTLAELNLLAGEAALASASYLQAAIYLLRGCSLVCDDDWNTHYNICLRLFTSSGEAQITQGMAEGSVTALTTVLKHGRSFNDKLPAHQALLTAYTIKGDHHEAIDHGLLVLKDLGEDFPSDADARQAASEADLSEICGILKSKSFDDIVSQSAIEINPTKILAMQVLMVVSRIAYNKDPKLMLLLVYRMVSRTMSSGLTAEASFAFAALAFALCGLGKYELSSFCARIASALLQKFGQRYSHIVILLLNCSILPYSQPQQACVQQLYTGYEDGMAVGAVEWALVNLSRNLQASLFAPDPNSTLADYLKRIVKANKVMVSFKHELNSVYAQILHQAIQNLSSNDETSDPFFSLTCDDDVLSKYTPQAQLHLKRKSLTFRIWFGRLFGKYDGMKDTIGNFQAIAARNPFAPSFDTHNDYFYIGLVAFAMLRNKAADKEYWASVASSVTEKFDEWVDVGRDWNFLSKRQMILAERAYCENDFHVAKSAYEEAIAKAKQNGFIHEEALACELAGNFFCERGEMSDGRYFLEKAVETYTRWGANRKAIHVKTVLSNYHSP